MAESKLFSPIQVGEMHLSHRVVLAPLTRYRTTDTHVPGPLVAEYYTQRGSFPGTFLIAEATFISPQAGGLRNVPGIYTDEQIEAWKKVTAAVHAKGSYIYLQLWALGRQARLHDLSMDDPSLPYVSSSASPLPDRPSTDPPPRALTIPEIKQYVSDYATAAANAVHKAGFDGVEVHGAHGYLPDQFLQDVCNKRDDEYGGSIPRRARFTLEVIDAIVKAVGEKRTALRVSPWATVHGMRMSDTIPTFSYLIRELRNAHPNLSYIHVVEPRVDGLTTLEVLRHKDDSNDFIRAIWQSGDGPGQSRLISAGGYTRQSAMDVADQKGDLIAYGRLFISNPDLYYRLLKNLPLTPSDRSTYYVAGSLGPEGYTDYPALAHSDHRL